MVKEFIAVFIIVFWLSFPFLASYMDVAIVEIDRTENSVISQIGVYFQFLTMTVPGVPIYLRFVIWSLQLISGLLLYLLIRA